MISEICNAIENMNLIEFYYDGFHRIVEPHTLGVNTRGNEVLSAYQIRRGSRRNNVPDWELFKIEKIESFQVLDENFSKTRPEYTTGDSRMVEIYCEL